MTGDSAYQFGLSHVVGLLQAEAQAHGQPAGTACGGCRLALDWLRSLRGRCVDGISNAVIIRSDVLDRVIRAIEEAQ